MSINAGAAAALRAHQEMLGYWLGVRRGAALPRRTDIDPAAMKRLLPGVLLIDVLGASGDYRIRLAGTGLYDLYGGEITGRRLEQIYPPAAAAYWREQLDAVRRSARPKVGVQSLEWRSHRQMQLLWLRLPLRLEGPEVRMILGYDAVVLAADGALAGRAA